MKYIKVYEDFDISNLSQYWNIVRPRNWESNLTNGTWEDDEISELVDLGFKKIGSNLMEFYSSMNIFIISIAKYYDEYILKYIKCILSQVHSKIIYLKKLNPLG